MYTEQHGKPRGRPVARGPRCMTEAGRGHSTDMTTRSAGVTDLPCLKRSN